jgi:NAD(P)-dependent dehydrogenase (short-subunit alcohol dehydrogenase family)
LYVLTGGGVLGRVTSTSPFTRTPIELEYEGHVVIDDDIARMRDHAITDASAPLETPVVLVLGTSMSAGKTMSGRVITRVLVENGYEVAACKLTGAGTYGDVLSMEVAGADPALEFVDAGLPTTVVPEARIREAIRPVLGRLQAADVIVAEVGASPLEPYNGATVIDMIESQVAFTLLCASDPYAVVGIEDAFECSPDLVAGIATNTTAGVDLIEELTGHSALDLQDEAAKGPLEAMLLGALPAPGGQ